jgi:hypothetical protein
VVFCIAALAALAGLWAPSAAAQETPPPQGVSRGENFSAKPPPALFASDCTGGGCHRSPQGLGKGQSQSSLTAFLREHYTNSRESAAALSNYILRTPGSQTAAPVEPREPRPSRTHPSAQSSRASARPEETPASARRSAEPAEKPTPRSQRGRHTTTAATPVPLPPPEPTPPPAAPPPPKQYDIFD